MWLPTGCAGHVPARPDRRIPQIRSRTAASDAFGETFCKNLGNPVGRQFVDALDLFARSIVNSATIMAPNRIILTGSLFESPEVRKALIQACASYDASLGTNRVIYSELAGKENYIGPVAICAKMLLYS